MALSKDLAGAVPAPPDVEPSVPPYWAEAKAELMRRDRIMNKLIPQFGDMHLRGHPDPFTTLARSIVGQQVTVKAAEVAWTKLRTLCPKMTPSQVIKAGAEELSGAAHSHGSSRSAEEAAQALVPRADRLAPCRDRLGLVAEAVNWLTRRRVLPRSGTDVDDYSDCNRDGSRAADVPSARCPKHPPRRLGDRSRRAPGATTACRQASQDRGTQLRDRIDSPDRAHVASEL